MISTWNNLKIYIDWNLCFICQQQGNDKLRSTPQGIKSLATNLFGFWQFGVRDGICSNVLPTVQNNADFESYLTEKEGKYRKVCANRYDNQKLQSVKDNQNTISTAECNSSGSRSCQKENKSFCQVLFVIKKIYQKIFMMLVRIMPKEK